MTISQESGNCRLYAKGYYPDTRYFISEKSNRLRRLQISVSFAADLEGLEDDEFIAAIGKVLDVAKDNGASEYFEVRI